MLGVSREVTYVTRWCSEKGTPSTRELDGAVALQGVDFHGIYCTGGRVRDVMEKPLLVWANLG